MHSLVHVFYTLNKHVLLLYWRFYLQKQIKLVLFNGLLYKMLKLINYTLNNQEYTMQYSLRFNFSHRADSRISLCSFRRNAFNAHLSCVHVKFRGMHTSPVWVEFLWQSRLGNSLQLLLGPCTSLRNVSWQDSTVRLFLILCIHGISLMWRPLEQLSGPLYSSLRYRRSNAFTSLFAILTPY